MKDCKTMDKPIAVNRMNTNSAKWDNQTEMFGREGLHAMWVADMDFRVPQCVTDAISDYMKTGVFGYYKVPESYYDAFISWEENHHGYQVKKEWIKYAPGVVPAINWLIQMLTEPSDSIIVLTPVYYPFLNSITNNKRNLVTCDLINTDGEYTIDFGAFEAAIKENDVKMFILCSPHNPVGRVWKKEELAQLLAICRQHHVFVLSDEIHQDLVFDNSKHIPTASIGDYDDMLITLTAASKTFNLAGCKNSIIIIPDETIRNRYTEFTTNIRITDGNSFGYIAVEAAYKDGQEWLDQVKEIIYSNYEYVRDTFARYLPDVVVSPLEGTYLLWLDFKAYLKPDEIVSFMQEKCGLAFDYGDWFGGERFQTFVRMNLATSRESVEYAVDQIIKELR